MGNKATKSKTPKGPLDFYLCAEFDKKIKNPSKAIDAFIALHCADGFTISREETVCQYENHIAVWVRGNKTSLAILYITMAFSNRVDDVRLLRAPENVAQYYGKDTAIVRLEHTGTSLAAQKG